MLPGLPPDRAAATHCAVAGTTCSGTLRRVQRVQRVRPGVDTPGHCGGRRGHGGSQQSGAPAELHQAVGAVDLRVDASQCLEQVGPDKHRRARHGQHITGGVVLALVQLARFDERNRCAQSVDRRPEIVEGPAAIVDQHLGSDDACVGLQGVLHHAPDRRVDQQDVVGKEQQEAGRCDSGSCGQPGGHGGTESGVPLHPGDRRAGQEASDAFHQRGLPRRGRRYPGIDHESLQTRVVLGRQARHHHVQGRPRVAGDQHGEHRRRRRSGCRIGRRHSTQRLVGDGVHGPRTLVPCRLCPACGRESQPGRRHAGRP